jgi:hypothetical protein
MVTNVQSDVKLMMARQIEQEPAKEELANGRFLLRTRASVANQTGIEKREVDRIVSQLARKGLVGNRMVFTKTGENRRRHRTRAWSHCQPNYFNKEFS